MATGKTRSFIIVGVWNGGSLRATVPVELLYYKTEGHGFFTDEHRHEYYRRLLDFLNRNLGGVKGK